MIPATEQLLRDTASHLQTYGWVQGVHSLGRRTCIGEALYLVALTTTSSFYYHHACQALTAVMGCTIPVFNDNHCETLRDALAVLDLTADLEAR